MEDTIKYKMRAKPPYLMSFKLAIIPMVVKNTKRATVDKVLSKSTCRIPYTRKPERIKANGRPPITAAGKLSF